MNYLIQRGKVRGQVINVPDGLPEILSDIAREALRCQPKKECLCQFIIDYLHSVIVTREKANVAKGIIDRALHKVDEIISDMCICDITKEKADQMALVMEECFRRFLEKRRCERGKEKEIVRFDEEDMLDELIAKCKFSEDELKISRPLIEEAYNRFVQAYMAAAESTDGTEALYQYFRERELRRWEEKLRNEAAIKIQSGFRGYLVRRSIIDKIVPKVSRTLKAGPLGEVPSELYRDMDKAARIIQKFFKDRFTVFAHQYEGLSEEEEESICSHRSKETVVGGVIGETAPDKMPPTLQVEAESEAVTGGPEEVVEEAKSEAQEPEPEAIMEAAIEPEPEPMPIEPEAAPEPVPEAAPEATAAPEPPEATLDAAPAAEAENAPEPADAAPEE